MKFYDLKIQNHLLAGGKIKNTEYEGKYIIYLDSNLLFRKDNGEYYTIKGQDLYSDKWEIIEPMYNWDKIMKDQILCVFSDDKDFKSFVISTLIQINYTDETYKTNENMCYSYCKVFNPEKFNIAENLKEYEK